MVTHRLVWDMCTCCHGNKHGICVYVVMVTHRLVWDMCICCHGNTYGICVYVVMATHMGYVYMLSW